MWLFSQDLGGKCVKWYGSGSEKGDKHKNAGKRCGPGSSAENFLPRVFQHRFRPIQQAQAEGKHLQQRHRRDRDQ